jgi:hypothetical protein
MLPFLVPELSTFYIQDVLILKKKSGAKGLNLNSTNYPDHGRHGNLPLQGKIPMAEPGIEPGTS